MVSRSGNRKETRRLEAEARQVVRYEDAVELQRRREAIEVRDNRRGFFGGVLADHVHVGLAHVHRVAAVGAVEDEDFGPAFTPEEREREARLRRQMEAKK